MNKTGWSATIFAAILSLVGCGQGAPSAQGDSQSSSAATTPASAPSEVREVAKDGFNACPYTMSEMQSAFGLALTGTPDTSMLDSANLASCRYEAAGSPTYVQIDYLWLQPDQVAQAIATAATGRAGGVSRIEGDADHASFQANTDMNMYALDYFRGNVMVTVRLISWSGSADGAQASLPRLRRHP